MVSTETPAQAVSSFVHLVTQWMSFVTCSVGSLRNSSHVHFLGSSISPSTTKFHSATGMRGVGPAERTVKSSTTYCTGGTRPAAATSRRLPRNPREMNDTDPSPPNPRSDELKLGADCDATADALADGAGAPMARVGALEGLAFAARPAVRARAPERSEPSRRIWARPLDQISARTGVGVTANLTAAALGYGRNGSGSGLSGSRGPDLGGRPVPVGRPAVGPARTQLSRTDAVDPPHAARVRRAVRDLGHQLHHHHPHLRQPRHHGEGAPGPASLASIWNQHR